MSGETLAAAPDLRIGQHIQDRYRIVRKLGEGGMGAVYEGEHLLIRRKVAIKCLHVQFASNSEMVARFQREAMAANAIRHPNIVEVTDMGRFDDGAIYMVLEFLEGCDVASVLQANRALPVSRAVHILLQVCDALIAAHGANIVHRDLKPENIYLTTRGDDQDFVKILDFGIAKYAESAGQAITRAGTTIGTPHYMSPEQAFGRTDLDHRADIYSLGVVLYQSLTGRVPFDDETFPGLLMKLVHMPAPTLSEHSPNVPPELNELVERMLAKDPNVRPQSCREVKAVLARFRELDEIIGSSQPLAGAGVASQPRNDSEGRTQTRVRRAVPMHGQGALKWLAPALLLAVLAVLAVVGVFAFGGSNPEPRPRSVAASPRRAEPQPAPSAPARPPSTVRVQIDATPEGTQLFLDGMPIGNPYDETVPASDRPRRLEARLERHRTISQELVASSPQQIHLVLAPETIVAAQTPASRVRRPERRAPVAPVIRPLAPRTSTFSSPRRRYNPSISSDEL